MLTFFVCQAAETPSGMSSISGYVCSTNSFLFSSLVPNVPIVGEGNKQLSQLMVFNFFVDGPTSIHRIFFPQHTGVNASLG